MRGINRPLDLDKSLDEIVAQASGLAAAEQFTEPLTLRR